MKKTKSARSTRIRLAAGRPSQTIRRGFARHLIGLAAIGGWLVPAPAVVASEPAPVAAKPAAAAKLPALTVTARKEPESAQQIPLSVTAVDRETLNDANVQTVKDASVYAPDVFVNEFSTRALSNPFFRGIGGSPGNPGVTTYMDGVPQLNAYSSNMELLDVDQVEFVRGPQGALFGRNTVGGLINITSRQPSLTDLKSWLDAEYGNYNLFDARLGVSGPIVKDQLGFSFAGGYSTRDGYTENDITGHDLDSRDGFFGKAQLFWKPASDWEARLIVSAEQDRDGDYALGDLAYIRAHPHHVQRDFEGYTDRDIFAPTLLVNHYGQAVDFAMITGLVSWETDDLTALSYVPTPAPIGSRHDSQQDLQFTEELRFASAKDAPLVLSPELTLKWQAGVSMFTQNYEQDAVNNYNPGVLYQPGSFFPGFPPGYSPANSQHAPQSSLDDIGASAYVQATLTACENLDFTLGLRGDYEEKSAEMNTFFATPDPLLGPPTRVSADRDFSHFSPQFALAYRPTPDATLYGTVSQGYRAGGFNPISPTAATTAYDEETSWNYEIGAKSAWFDNRLSVNLAAFYIRWSDLQLNQPTGLGYNYYIANAGGAESKGVELELKARPCEGLDLFASVGITDSEFRDGATATWNHTATAVGGKNLIYTPQYTANGGLQYSFAVSEALSLYARAEATAYGRYYYNAVNNASQAPYSLANFRAGVRGDKWFAEAWVNNAFDTNYVPIALEWSPGSMLGESGAPLTFGLRAGLNF